MARFPLVAVVGPIGAGKSTVASALAGATGFHEWPERVGDNPFFERFCADPATWALRSQLAFMLSAVEDAAAARRQGPGAVLERPVQEMFGVFVNDQLDHGILDPDEQAMLGRVVDLGERLAGLPDVLVVLTARADELLDRIRARGRAGEDAYDLGYMRRLDARYRTWTAAWPGSVVHVDVEKRDLREETEIRDLAAEVTEHIEYARHSQ